MRWTFGSGCIHGSGALPAAPKYPRAKGPTADVDDFTRACNERFPQPPYPFTDPASIFAEELAASQRHVGAAADFVKEAAAVAATSGLALDGVTMHLGNAFEWIDRGFCAAVRAFATGYDEKQALDSLLRLVRQSLDVLRSMLPVISAALKRAYAEGYSQGWIDGFDAGYAAAVTDRQDEWDKLLADLKRTLKIGVPIVLGLLGVGVAVAFVGWVASFWKGRK